LITDYERLIIEELMIHPGVLLICHMFIILSNVNVVLRLIIIIHDLLNQGSLLPIVLLPGLGKSLFLD